MRYLPLANIMHYPLRSALSALGIGIGVCMLITLSGLSRGTLSEIADRWESVDAELIVLPRGWGESAADKSGAGLPDRHAERIMKDHADLVRHVVPIFTWPVKLAGQDQLAVGVDGNDLTMLSGGRLPTGRMFDPEGNFARWLEQKLLTPAKDDQLLEITEQDLQTEGRNGLELIIDTRLAQAGGYRLNQEVFTANHHWTIVGIVPTGAMSRVFLPRRTAQFLFASGDLRRSTLMFVKLREGVDVGPASRAIADSTGQDVIPLARYRGMLQERFGIMYLYVDAVNVLALAIAFLFIMVTLYMMVLQRTREIAILKSAGASSWFLVRQVLAESLLLTGAGVTAGVGLSFLAGMGIQAVRPLLTVTITAQTIVQSAALALVGALSAGAYPAWRAVRVDMVEALSYE